MRSLFAAGGLASVIPLLLSAFICSSAEATNLWSDPAYIQRQAELQIARLDGVSAQKAVTSMRDSEAVSSATCTQLDEARKEAAVAFMERGQPPDPSRVIQNSTCYLDVIGIKIPVALTGIGWLDGVISNVLQKVQAGACGKLNSYVDDLKNNAASQIRNTTGGALNLGQLNADSISLNIGGQNVQVNGSTDVSSVLQQAGNTAATQAVNEATANIGQSTYDSINGTLDPNAGQALSNAQGEVKRVQCQQRGVGANETCPCPAASSLSGGTQNVYPQCADTYQPWYYGGDGA